MSAPLLCSDASSFERVLDALGDRVVRRDGQRRHVDARCPAHDDQHPSLTVDWTENPHKGGMTLLRCHGPGCDVREIVSALGLRVADTYDTPPSGASRQSPSSPRVQARKPSSSKRGQTTKGVQSGRAPLGALEAEYPYCDADGVVLGWMRRYEGKQFRWRRLDEKGQRVSGQPKPCPLYLLPAVRAAIEAGNPVHLAEGEKDADALGAVGVTATTVPNGVVVTQTGAAKNLVEEHLAALRGAHVVVWADRDGPDKKSPERGYQGYRHAMRMRDRLEGYAASVRVVEAASGKDASDHLAAGYSVDNAPAITPEHRVPGEILTKWGAAAPSGDEGRPAGEHEAANIIDFPGTDRESKKGGNGGGGSPEKRQVYLKDRYEVHKGALVAVKETDKEVVRTELLNAEAYMVCRVVRDIGDDIQTQALVDLEVRQGSETHLLRSLPWKEFEDPTKWVGRVPFPLVFDRGFGKGKLANAITSVSGAVPVETAYGLLGWRELHPGQWAYLHAGGAIGADGPILGTRVEVSPRLRGFTMPPDLPEGQDLRDAFDSLMVLADTLPHHIAYPLIAAGCRAVLGDCSTSLFCLGNAGTLKSGTAALIQQMYWPAARYDRLPAGAGEDATTTAALEQLVHEAGHSAFVIDDLAPDRGAARSAARAAALVRSLGNRQSKARLSRDTDEGLRADKPPRTLAILTGEDQPTVESAERRTVYIPFRVGEITVDLLKQIGTPELAGQRNALAAALARYAAPKQPAAEWLEQQRDEWSTWLAHSQDVSNGIVAGHCNLVGDLITGLRAVLDMVTEAGVVSRDEAAQRWHEGWAAMRRVLEVQNELADGRSLSDRFAELVRSALSSGRAHLRNGVGKQPPNAAAFGWVEETSAFDPGYRALGHQLGWTDGATIWLEPGTSFAVAEAEGRAQSDPLDVSKRALKNKLAAAYPEAFMPSVSGSAPRERREMLSGVRRRVWALPYEWLYPDDAEDEDTPTPEDPPPPGGPDGHPSLPAGGGPTPPAAPTDYTSQKASEKTAQTTTRTQQSDRVNATGSGAQRDSGRRYDAAGVVVDVDAAYLVDGQGHIDPPTEATTLSEVLEWALELNLGVHHSGGKDVRRRGVRDDAGLVVIMPKLAKKLGVPAKRPNPDKPTATAKKQVAALEEAGWRVGKRGLQAYTQVWRQQGNGSDRAGRSHFAVFPQWSTDPIWDKAADASLLAYRLTLYTSSLGYQLVYNAGATGVGIVRQCRARSDHPLVTEVTDVPPPGRKKDHAPIEEMEWEYWRDPTEEEQRCTHVVGIDVNASYLAAAAQTMLSHGAPSHHRAPQVEQINGTPGYFLLDPITTPAACTTAPDLLDMHAGLDRSRHTRTEDKPFFVTAPMLAALREAGEEPVIREAWLYDGQDENGKPTCGKHLQTWANLIRDALYGLKPEEDFDPDVKAVLAELKLTYAAGLGQLASEQYRSGSPMWLPYWNHAVKATAQTAIWRKVKQTSEQTGLYPLGISRDAVYYAVTSDDPMPRHEAAMALAPVNLEGKGGFRYTADGYRVGYTKWAGSATFREYLAARAVTDPKKKSDALESIWTTPKNDGWSE